VFTGWFCRGKVGKRLVQQLTSWHCCFFYRKQQLSRSLSVLLFPSAADRNGSPLWQWMQQQAQQQQPVQTPQLLQSLAGLPDGRPAAAVFMFDEAKAAAGSAAPFTCLAVQHSLPAAAAGSQG
jgi:hypothetical protein